MVTMKGFNGFKLSGSPRDNSYSDKPSIPSINLSDISNFNLLQRKTFDLSKHPARDWTDRQVVNWLHERGLQEYETMFMENDINGEVLFELTHSLLKMMNCSTVGSRVRILEAIKELKRDQLTNFKAHAFQKNQEYKKPLSFEYGMTPPVSPEISHCLRVFGSDNQTRFVNVSDVKDAHSILSKVLAKFHITEDPSKYAVFVVNGDSTRSLQDEELVEICSNLDRPEREKFILRKKHLPPNHVEFKKLHAQRLAAGKTGPKPEALPPGVTPKQMKLTKIFGTRPPSELISSNLDRFFPVHEKILPSQNSESFEDFILSLKAKARPSALGLTYSPTTYCNLPSLMESSPSSSPPEPHSASPTLNSPMSYEESEASLVTGNDGQIRWHKGHIIGAGSFGDVYMGLNVMTGELMAVKQVVLPSLDSGFSEMKPSDIKKQEVRVDALQREIELLRKLSHPNIVRYIGFQRDDTHLNILLEYIPGGSITGILAAYGPLQEGLIKSFIRQVLQGLAFLHAQGIVHRDIKGGNILVDNKGQAKISDFGISKQIQEEVLSSVVSQRASLQGSVFWMAPEVVKQTYYTHKADIWGLGCLVIEMLTGTHPFPQFNQMQAIFQIGSMIGPDIPEHTSPACRRFLEQTFKINHHERPSADELLEHEFLVDCSPVLVV